ncbi:unnamed protein product, partial [Cyprideis torosa]
MSKLTIIRTNTGKLHILNVYAPDSTKSGTELAKMGQKRFITIGNLNAQIGNSSSNPIAPEDLGMEVLGVTSKNICFSFTGFVWIHVCVSMDNKMNKTVRWNDTIAVDQSFSPTVDQSVSEEPDERRYFQRKARPSTNLKSDASVAFTADKTILGNDSIAVDDEFVLGDSVVVDTVSSLTNRLQ